MYVLLNNVWVTIWIKPKDINRSSTTYNSTIDWMVLRFDWWPLLPYSWISKPQGGTYNPTFNNIRVMLSLKGHRVTVIIQRSRETPGFATPKHRSLWQRPSGIINCSAPTHVLVAIFYPHTLDTDSRNDLPIVLLCSRGTYDCWWIMVLFLAFKSNQLYID